MNGAAIAFRAQPTHLALVLALLLAVAFSLSPLTVLMLVCLLSALAFDAKLSWVFVLASCLLLVLLNLSKDIEGDLLTYTRLQHHVEGRSPLVLFSVDELRLVSSTYRVTELGFYVPLYLLATVFPDSESVIPVAATLAIYLCTFLGLRIIAHAEQWNQRLILTVAFVVFFAAINFVQSTHLVRQYISASVVFCALAFFIGRKPWSTLVAILLACSIHNATALVVANFALAAAAFPYRAGKARHPLMSVLYVVALSACFVFTVASIVLHEIGHRGNEDENIAVWHYVVAAALLGIVIVYSRAQRQQTRTSYYASLAFALIYALSVTFFLLGFETQALRFFGYLEWLSGLLVATLLCCIPRSRLGLYIFSRWAVCALSTFLFLMRIHGSSWAYGPGRTDLFVQSLLGMAEYLGG